ncbi:MAG TPA: polysaccharide biosynthesis/export family protein [Bryobacteraceae bacterium]|nr:polysaccharide biosynthesis/export family protein [Bryobacteraceae bacterium]HOQ44889.1 polysaccharide biosynthesis/export family protein [Bryobacteraceae bacterium]HPQ14948.1 polysaccharide biosynthesis/export family protein [Bryobacteraceae bacterium]HPU72101.1 polysaccharide biosynthesis/export family protein [Bryobacteraceae bacterium]
MRIQSTVLILIVAAQAGVYAAPAQNAQAGETKAAVAAAKLDTPQGSYRIGPGDVLQIMVWKEPDASVPSIQVRSDGYITVPFVKELHVVGLTPSEVETLVTQRLSRFLRNPEVSVLVRETNRDKVYVIGAVRREGSIPLRSPMTVIQVLAEAGGVSEFAKKKKIYILRNNGERQQRIAFNYEAAIRGDPRMSNLYVAPGDTIVVP